MLSPAQIKASPHYETLKNAVEVRHAKKYALMYALLTLVSGFLLWTPISVKEDPGAYSFLVVLVVVGMSPFWLFYLLRIALIYQRIDGYLFREVVLDRPHGGMMRDSIYFTVELPDRQGKPVTAETNSIFSSRGTVQPAMEDYVNQKALLAYHPETERVVVIRKLDA